MLVVLMLAGLLLIGSQFVYGAGQQQSLQALAALDQNTRLHPRMQAWRRPVYRKSVPGGRRDFPGSSEETRVPSDNSASDHGSDPGPSPLAPEADGERRVRAGGILSQGLW